MQKTVKKEEEDVLQCSQDPESSFDVPLQIVSNKAKKRVKEEPQEAVPASQAQQSEPATQATDFVFETPQQQDARPPLAKLGPVGIKRQKSEPRVISKQLEFTPGQENAKQSAFLPIVAVAPLEKRGASHSSSGSSTEKYVKVLFPFHPLESYKEGELHLDFLKDAAHKKLQEFGLLAAESTNLCANYFESHAAFKRAGPMSDDELLNWLKVYDIQVRAIAWCTLALAMVRDHLWPTHEWAGPIRMCVQFWQEVAKERRKCLTLLAEKRETSY